MLTHRFGLTLLASCVLLIGCGGSGGGDNPAAAPVATQLELLAGHIGGAGNIDGVGSAARFNSPQAAVRGPSGEVYVADTGNHLIRRINTDGKVSVWAGRVGSTVDFSSGGHADGERLSAQFSSPSGIAIGSDGTVYVADRGNSVIRAISPAGIVRTLAGQVLQPGSTDGVGTVAQLTYPSSLLMEPSGSLLVVEYSGGLRTLSPEGVTGTVKTSLPEGFQLTGAGLDKAGHRLVAGRRGSTTSGAALYRLDGDGNATLLAGDPWVSGTTDGDSAAARFGTITSIVEVAEGNLLIADGYSNVFAGARSVQTGGTTLRKLSANGTVSTVAGRGLVSGSTDGDSATSLLCGPTSLKAYDGTTWLVTDKCNHAIRLLGSDGQLKTLAGLAPTPGNADGTGDQARFNTPWGIAMLQDGNAYVADFGNSSIRRISANGQSSQLASIGAEIGPMWLASNGSNEFCFSDYPRVRLPSRIITIRCAGSDGTLRNLASQWNTEGIQQFNSVAGITSGRQGNWLFTDASVSANALYSISSTGSITSQIKNLKTVGAITSDQNGVVYLRFGNSIQKRTNDGSLKLVAGSPDIAGQQNGAGPEARFGNITALAVDALNYLYVADDSGTTTIRIISPSGEVSTLAGTPGQSGVRLGNAPGSLATINGLAVATDQQTLLATTANGVIRITLQR